MIWVMETKRTGTGGSALDPSSQLRSQIPRGKCIALREITGVEALAIAGTVAMFLVGGGILLHGLPSLHHLLQHAIAPLDGAAVNALLEGLAGVAAGALALAGVKLVQPLLRRLRGR